MLNAVSEGQKCEVRVEDDSCVVGGGVGRQEEVMWLAGILCWIGLYINPTFPAL